MSDSAFAKTPTRRQRIFKKYERLVQTSPGTGLGLALARAGIKAQGGRLWVEDSRLGAARFVLVLPNVAESHVPE